MPTFLFLGYKEGASIGGCKNFANEKMLGEYLDKKGITNYQIFTSKTSAPKSLKKLVSDKDLSIFCRQMSVMFFSDITLLEGVEMLSEQTDNMELKTALFEINEHMKKAISLSEAMSMYTNIFNQYFINMIKIGESSGTLDTVFLKMSGYFEKEDELKKKVKSALTYPVILSIMMAAVIALLVVKILPMFSDILKSFGGNMPAITAWILNVSNFLLHYGIATIVVIVVIIFGLFLFSKTEKGRFFFDKAKVKNPFVKNLYSKIIVSRFSRSLGILLRSGVSIVTALKEVNVLVENRFLKNKFDKAVLEIEEGKDLAESLKKVGVFPPLFIRMIIIGNSAGRLDDMLEKTASIFDQEVKDYLDKSTSLIEPILIIILSIVVGIILMSVILPMISIMNQIG